MILIVVVDDRNGMMFNKRRQSQDSILCEKIVSLSADSRLFMNRYSSKLFQNYKEQIIVDEDFVDIAADDEYCFAENVLPDETQVKKIILFKWNRKYPGDFYFNIDLSSWKMEKTEDFAGTSHDNITMEVYTK